LLASTASPLYCHLFFSDLYFAKFNTNFLPIWWWSIKEGGERTWSVQKRMSEWVCEMSKKGWYLWEEADKKRGRKKEHKTSAFCFLSAEIRSRIGDNIVKNFSLYDSPAGIIRSNMDRCSHCADPVVAVVVVLCAADFRTSLIQDVINCDDVWIVFRW
jgi:hypothetical protein